MSTSSNSVIADIQAALATNINVNRKSILTPKPNSLKIVFDYNPYDITVTKFSPDNREVMDFGSALRCLKNGCKVARKGWHAKDKYLWYVPSTRCSGIACNDEELKKIAEKNGGDIKTAGYVCMYLTEGGQPLVLKGWMPTPCDMLAEDWYVVE